LPHLSERGTAAIITNQYIDLEGPLERLANAESRIGRIGEARSALTVRDI
jgi:hypothetical protein